MLSDLRKSSSVFHIRNNKTQRNEECLYSGHQTILGQGNQQPEINKRITLS